MSELGCNSRSAVSPVIAVILMVAVTTLLAAGVFTLVNGMAETGTSESMGTSAAVNVDQTETGNLTFTYVSGDASTVRLLQNGTVVANITSVGESVTLSNEKTVIVGVSSSGETRVVSTHNPSTTVTSTASLEPINFFEGFEDGDASNWTTNNWSVVSGGYNGSSYKIDHGSDGTKIKYTGDTFSKDVKYKAWFKVSGSYADFRLIFHNQSNGSHYRVDYYPDGTDNPVFRILYMNSSSSVILNSTSPSIDYTQWTKMTVVRWSNGTIFATVTNGTHTDTLRASDSRLSSGRFEIGAWNDVYADNISVTRP